MFARDEPERRGGVGFAATADRDGVAPEGTFKPCSLARRRKSIAPGLLRPFHIDLAGPRQADQRPARRRAPDGAAQLACGARSSLIAASICRQL